DRRGGEGSRKCGRRCAGRCQGAHARFGRRQQHGRSNRRGIGETVLVPKQPPRESTGRNAFLVAAGIFLSRIAGLLRQYAFAHYFGLRSDQADAFNQAFRIPNFLQTLFGEGVLSASFIPVYARLLAGQDEERAGRVAGAVAAILALVTSVIVLL